MTFNEEKEELRCPILPKNTSNFNISNLKQIIIT